MECCLFCRKAVLDLMQHNWIVADKIMTCFALGLGLPEDFFRGEMDPKHPTNCTAMVRKDLLHGNRSPAQQ